MFRVRFLCCAVLVFAAGRLFAADPSAVVLVISDGTSQELITAARIYGYGVEGHLGLESFPQTAIVRTHSREDAVTDSSAGATAMARGIKADNRAVGMVGPNSKSGPPSVLDLAREAGWSTGVVTDDSVTGATPASFLVEHKSRWEEPQIASKIVDHLGPRADIVLGGGAKWFTDLAKVPGVVYQPGQREAVAATQAKLAGAKIAVFDRWQPFVDAVAKGGDDRPVLGTFYPAEFPFYADGPRTPRVADMAVEAVRFLRAKGKSFFLMVEAGLPDKACHLGQAKRAVVEVLELDHLLAELRKNLPPDSLLLVTTDHETGGLAINGPPVPISVRGDTLMERNPIVAGQSILSWATGPGGNLPASNLRATREPGKPQAAGATPKQPSDDDYQQPAAMASGAASHTGGDVWLLGEGPGSENVHGYLENTDIFRLLAAGIKARSR